MALEINSRIENDLAVLDLEGRLWILDLPLHDHVRDLLNRGCRYFILNLEKVEYMDSSGLGQLVALWTSVRTNGGNLVLMRPTERVRKLLDVTRLNVIFDAYREEPKAKAASRRDA